MKPAVLFTEVASTEPVRIQRKTWKLLLLVLLSALALRAWYGSWNLNQNRFWDEQYALKNVRSLLLTGDVKPVNAYYPSPVWSVPQAAVLKLSDVLYTQTGNGALRVLDDQFGFTPTGILLCRWIQAIYGTLAVWFVFLAGRRLFTSQIALVAAAMVAFAPWAIHASGYIKPDGLLLMSITMAFWASLAAVDSPTVKRHLLAGLAIALALSSKLTGGLIAMPLVVAVAILGWRERRRVGLLVVAGASSAAFFIALNPYWLHYLSFLSGLKRDYAMRAGWAEMTRLSMPGRVVGFITDGYLHGLVLGSVSLVGFALLAVGVLRRGRPGGLGATGDLIGEGGATVRSRGGELINLAKRAMFLVFPLLYTLVYIVQTPYFKPNNFLPLALFTALSAAWLLIGCWRWVSVRWPLVQHPAIVGVLAVILVAGIVLPGWLYTYRSVTPTTRDLARLYLDQELNAPPSAKLVFAEAWQEPRPPWGSGERRLHDGLSAIHEVPNLEKLSPRALDLSDGLVFFGHRQIGGKTFLREREVGGPEAQVTVFRAQPFKARGPTMVAVAYGWLRNGPYLDLTSHPCIDAAPGCRAVDLPVDLVAEELASFFVLLTWDSLGESAETPHIEVGDRSLDLVVASKQPSGMLYVSPRFQLGDGPRVARLVRDDDFGDDDLEDDDCEDDDLEDDDCVGDDCEGDDRTEGGMLIQLARWVPGRAPS